MNSLLLIPMLTVLLIDATEDPKNVLSDHGVKLMGRTAVMADEPEFRSQLTKSTKIKKAMQAAAKRLAIGEHQLDQLERNIAGLKAANVTVNAHLTVANPNNVGLYNRLVGANNANVAQIELLQKHLRGGRKQIEEMRTVASQVQEEFIKSVLETRELADAIEAKRRLAANDESVQAALSEVNETEKKEYALDKPSRAFSVAVDKLKDLEALVLSEKIAIRRDVGGTSRVSVVVNGDKAIEMVIDSGASIISLPAAAALELNVTPAPTDPSITLVMADGRQITGVLVKLKTVRVGQFVVEDVDCAVLGSDAVNADPLLGMSFLKEFEFRINSADATLTLTHVNDDPAPTRSRGR